MVATIRNLTSSSATIAIEACTGAIYWQRKFKEVGHRVKIVSPQYVKPFVRRQNTDGNDAEAICTAARQTHMRFVPMKTVEQQDVQALLVHDARSVVRTAAGKTDPFNAWVGKCATSRMRV